MEAEGRSEGARRPRGHRREGQVAWLRPACPCPSVQARQCRYRHPQLPAPSHTEHRALSQESVWGVNVRAAWGGGRATLPLLWDKLTAWISHVVIESGSHTVNLRPKMEKPCHTLGQPDTAQGQGRPCTLTCGSGPPSALSRASSLGRSCALGCRLLLSAPPPAGPPGLGPQGGVRGAILPC